MSLLRVHEVTARKPQGKCPKCEKAIKPGTKYRWWKGRYTAKRIRCAACPAPSISERESNDKLSRVYGAQETCQDALNKATTVEVAQGAVEDAISELEEVKSEYEDSASNIREHFPDSENADNADEAVSSLETWIDELTVAKDDIETAPKEGEDRDAWRQTHLGEALRIIGECPL